MKDPLKLFYQPELDSPALIVGWSLDAGKLGDKVSGYLVEQLGGQPFGEIEPLPFFALGGVPIEENLVQFPEGIFYVCPEHNLIVLISTPPFNEWFKFLNTVLDVALQCRAKEVYTVGGMVSMSAHTTPRELMGTFNSPQTKESLSRFGLSRDMDYETPPGQRPTLNSFLIWAAHRREVQGTSLWIPIPFYLIPWDDPKAQKRVLEFFDQRFSLSIDFAGLDSEINEQNRKIARLREESPEVNDYITKLESNLPLSEEESQKLAAEVESALRKTSE